MGDQNSSKEQEQIENNKNMVNINPFNKIISEHQWSNQLKDGELEPDQNTIPSIHYLEEAHFKCKAIYTKSK